MKTQPDQSFRSAFTLPELLMVLAVSALVASVVLQAIMPRKPRAATRIRCVNNLKNIGLSFLLFATDHDGRYPMQISTWEGASGFEAENAQRVWRHFAVMSNEVSTPTILLCPDDRRGRIQATNWSESSTNKLLIPFARNANISYFVGIEAAETNRQMLLSGDRHITNRHPDLFIFGKATVGNLGTNHNATNGAGWHKAIHKAQGNVTLADGSVVQLTTARLRDQLQSSGDARNRLAVPD
jgi:prepilin-type N-terminal cleavage/methylation domain-containing protein